jgi:riboflavin biosynthesis pyrimidine reductase
VTKPDYTALAFPGAPEGRPYVIVNMVMSADGKVVIEGTEQGIGSKADQRLMRELRVHADVILNGAATLRASGASPRLGGDEALEQLRLARGKPRFPTSSVLSGSGDLPLDRIFFTADDFHAVVYLAGSAPADRVEAIRATGRPVVMVPTANPLQSVLGHMRKELGASLLLVEGGPTLNRQLFDLGAVDEFFLTLGPVVVGGAHGLSAVGGDGPYPRDGVRRLDLVHAIPNEETGEVYLRYRVVSPGMTDHISGQARSVAATSTAATSPASVGRNAARA